MSSQTKSVYLTAESIKMIEQLRDVGGFKVSTSQVIERAIRIMYTMKGADHEQKEPTQERTQDQTNLSDE